MMYMNYIYIYIYLIRNDLGIGLLESGDILFDPSFGLKTWYKNRQNSWTVSVSQSMLGRRPTLYLYL